MRKFGHVDVGHTKLVVLGVKRVSVALSHVVDLDSLHLELVPVVRVFSIERRLQVNAVNSLHVLRDQ